MPYIPKLSDYRLRLGWSQAELARKAGIDRATVSRCENGYAVTDVSCATIKSALEAEAELRRVQLQGLTVIEGGKNGDMPKKGRRKPPTS